MKYLTIFVLICCSIITGCGYYPTASVPVKMTYDNYTHGKRIGFIGYKSDRILNIKLPMLLNNNELIICKNELRQEIFGILPFDGEYINAFSINESIYFDLPKNNIAILIVNLKMPNNDYKLIAYYVSIDQKDDKLLFTMKFDTIITQSIMVDCYTYDNDNAGIICRSINNQTFYIYDLSGTFVSKSTFSKPMLFSHVLPWDNEYVFFDGDKLYLKTIKLNKFDLTKKIDFHLKGDINNNIIWDKGRVEDELVGYEQITCFYNNKELYYFDHLINNSIRIFTFDDPIIDTIGFRMFVTEKGIYYFKLLDRNKPTLVCNEVLKIIRGFRIDIFSEENSYYIFNKYRDSLNIVNIYLTNRELEDKDLIRLLQIEIKDDEIIESDFNLSDNELILFSKEKVFVYNLNNYIYKGIPIKILK